MKKIIAILILAASCLTSAGSNISGIVFLDKNSNGVLDKGENGIKGILVSNGETIVSTNSKGKYCIEANPNECIFPILPPNRCISSTRNQNSAFRLITDDAETVNFGLCFRADYSSFTLNAIGDVQVGSLQELEYADRSIFSELAEEKEDNINLFLGDEVNETMELLPHIGKDIGMLPQESWTLIGNHDRDDAYSYEKVFGARDFAFLRGNAFFIVLDNVFSTGKHSYKGHLTQRQLDFISNCLKHIPSGAQIVLCAHIPFWETDNFSDVLSLLEGRGNVLAISAHLHEIERKITEGRWVTVNEVSVGATCGHWWTGEKDWEGIPSAIMNSGAPRGYFIFNFTKTGYDFRFKGVGLDAHKQMSINISSLDEVEADTDSLNSRKRGEIYVTAFGGCDSTLVEFRIDGGKWSKAEKAKAMDANVAITRELNRQKSYPTAFSKMNPLRHLVSKQVWKGEIANPTSGTHLVEVRATDKYGFSVKGARTFSFQ